ncbi:MAG: alpha/beta hydrolase domain-containing protein [Gemmataceae bacterium]
MTRWLPSLLVILLASPSRAELVRIDWHTREAFAGGQAFGDVGPYEKLVGVAHFEVDPTHPRNRPIVDLDLAVRTAKGRVAFAADVYLLKPRDPARGNGAILYDVNNRGSKLALGMFNDARGGNDPTTAGDAGNGFLFRRGYTLVWCGWVGELLPGGGRLLLQAPEARLSGKPLTGVVRYEVSSDRPVDSLPLSRRDGHGSYPPTEKGEREGVLTWRMRETDERVVVPRGQWSLERLPVPKGDKGVPGTLPPVRLKVAGGFRPGYLYELVCESSGSVVQGVGFAAVRDLVSYLKHDHSTSNPLRSDERSAIRRAHGFGVSQSGRFLRHLLWQGFNVDERGRLVFDGLMPHVAGGGLGCFNHRFAQPTRHNGQHEDHLYPADVFPFTYGDSDDDFAAGPDLLRRRSRPDGILHRLTAEPSVPLPKILHTQTSAEYWHRSGSLVHTDTLGTADAPIPANVRIYAFGGTQHGPAGFPPGRGGSDHRHNPADYRPHLRALLDALDAWVRDGTSPPPSVYPRLADGTLVDWRQTATGFPSLPGVRYPEVIQQPSALDLGTLYASRGIITVEPPRILGHYRVLVPATDADGNDRGMLQPLEVAVPLATYTGWNLRSRDVGVEAMLASLAGAMLPFPRTEAERNTTGDPRVSIEKRYGDAAGYRRRWQTQRDRMVQDRHLLPEDAERLTEPWDGSRTGCRRASTRRKKE